MEVFPIPPVPTRARGMSCCAKPMISSINPSRPKKALGSGRRGSTGTLKISDPLGIEASGLLSVWPGVSMGREMGGTALETYCLILTASILADLRYALEDIRNDGVSIQNELGLQRNKSAATRQRHVERTLKT